MALADMVRIIRAKLKEEDQPGKINLIKQVATKAKDIYDKNGNINWITEAEKPEKVVIPGSISDLADRQQKLQKDGYFDEYNVKEGSSKENLVSLLDVARQKATERLQKLGWTPTETAVKEDPQQSYVVENLNKMLAEARNEYKYNRNKTYEELKQEMPEAVNWWEKEYGRTQEDPKEKTMFLLDQFKDINATVESVKGKSENDQKEMLDYFKRQYPDKYAEAESNYRATKGVEKSGYEFRAMTEAEKLKLQREQIKEQEEALEQEEAEMKAWVEKEYKRTEGIMGPHLSYEQLKNGNSEYTKELEDKFYKDKRVSNFLSGVVSAFDRSLIDKFGEEQIAEMEKNAVLSPQNFAEKFIDSASLNTFSTLLNEVSPIQNEGGKLMYNGFIIGDEYITEEGRETAEASNWVPAFLGGMIPYGKISGSIKQGIEALSKAKSLSPTIRRVAKKAIELTKKYPVIAEMSAYNFAEESADAFIRKGTGQNYTWGNFLMGLSMGAIMGGAFEIGGKLLSKGTLEKFADKAEKVLSETKDFETTKNIEVDGIRLGSMYQEARLAYQNGGVKPSMFGESRMVGLTGGRKGVAGVDYSAELPKAETRIDEDMTDPIPQNVLDVFDEFKAIEKGKWIDNPSVRIDTPFKIADQVLEIMNANGKVSFTRKSIKHISEKGPDADRLLRQIPEILKNPDELRKNTEDPSRFYVVKTIETKGNRPQVVTLEVVKDGDGIIITSFQSDNEYLKKFPVLWRTGDSRESVPPSHPYGLAAPEFSALKEMESTNNIPVESPEVKTEAQARSEKVYAEGKAYEEEIDNMSFGLNNTKAKEALEALQAKPKNEQEAKEAFQKYSNAVADEPEFVLSPQAYEVLDSAQYYKDITGFTGQARDIYRNSEVVFGKDYEKFKKEFLDPFDEAKGNYIDQQKALADELDNYIVKDLGIKKGSKESEAIMNYGERFSDEKYKNWDENYLTEKFGVEKAQKIIEADRWFRSKYDAFIDIANEITARIYPRNPDKIIPKRKDYYRHYRELSGIGGLLNIFDTPANIDSVLSGISENTKPKSKFLSFARRRLGFKSERDAVGGFINYIPSLAYRVNIDPQIAKFRVFARELGNATEKTANVNNYKEFLEDWTNDLAGKTNTWDRPVQKLLGRKVFGCINWFNNRVKANQILGNAGSMIAQIFNVPQGIASAKQHSIMGLFQTVGQIWKKDPVINKSIFVKERYSDSMYNKFDSGILANTKKFAVWMTGVLDEVGTKFIWNSHYQKGIKDGVKDPIKYADDTTRKLVAGRGVGEVPLIQKAKMTKLLMPFQLEVANTWWILKDMVSKKQFGSIATFMATSWVMNRMAEKIKGSDVVFDPIQAVIDGVKTIKQNKITDAKRIALIMGGRLLGEMFSNIPGGQTIAQIYPEFGNADLGLPARQNLFGAGDPTRFGSGPLLFKGIQSPVFSLVPGFGGAQIKKTYKTARSIMNDGEVKSKSGKSVNFKIDLTDKLSVAKAILYGQYASDEGREYLMQMQEKLNRGWLTTEEKEAEKEAKKKSKKTTSSGLFQKKSSTSSGLFQTKSSSGTTSSGLFQKK
jgi:hypothetical protein